MSYGTKGISTNINTDSIFESKMFLASYKKMFERKSLNRKTKKVLIVEDDLDMSDILQNRLKKMYNCNVDVAADPYEAMNMMIETYYDLIILDWNLPVLNGGETLLRAEEAMVFEPFLPIQWDQKEVPVVVLSASDKDYCKVKRTKHFKSVGFISKAQPLNKILTLIANFMEIGTIPSGYALSQGDPFQGAEIEVETFDQ